MTFKVTDRRGSSRTGIVEAPTGRAKASAGAFVAADRYDPDTTRWRPHNYSGRSALDFDREPLVSRIHDLARNDGWTSGGLTKFVDTVIGSGWRLSAKPNARTLGISPEAAREFSKDVEATFADDAEDPDCWFDARRSLSFGGLLALAMRHRIMDGEALGVIRFEDRGGPFATCLQMIDPDRLSNPWGARNTDTLCQGIELDGLGAPVAYQIRTGHPGDLVQYGYGRSIAGAPGAGANPLRSAYTWTRVEREIVGVRRQVLHTFEPTRADEVRGTPPLASVVKAIRMTGRYQEAEAQAALLNAVMAAFVESPFDQEQLAEAINGDGDLKPYQDQRMQFHDGHPLIGSGVKVNFMFPGEKVTLTQPHHPNATYEPFVRASLRNIASAMGLTYEQLSADWSQVNYSSARAALIEVWRGFTARGSHFALQWVQPLYAAWLGENIARGRIKLPAGGPDYFDAKSAYCAAEWIGPGRGFVDPLKEALATQLRLAMGLTTRKRMAAEQGDDFDDILAEAAQERRDMLAADLDPRLPVQGALVAAELQAAPERAATET